MGSRIYGPTVIGPHCRVGGEVSNSVFLGFSNKGHDGFLGNSVIGHWCNLGADTNTSNLKNNYSSVRLWDSASAELKATDLQFCGLIMGDHCKCAINTMFDTGTYIGSASMLTGSSFIPKHVPPFSWGGDGKWTEHRFEQFVATAKVVMERRQHLWNEDDETKWREELESSRAMRKALL
jgi:UDP-N-acetylglucosamine diphosphorylase/glucosamine-1-phosphate N-acetyltransferase